MKPGSRIKPVRQEGASEEPTATDGDFEEQTPRSQAVSPRRVSRGLGALAQVVEELVDVMVEEGMVVEREAAKLREAIRTLRR